MGRRSMVPRLNWKVRPSCAAAPSRAPRGPSRRARGPKAPEPRPRNSVQIPPDSRCRRSLSEIRAVWLAVFDPDDIPNRRESLNQPEDIDAEAAIGADDIATRRQDERRGRFEQPSAGSQGRGHGRIPIIDDGGREQDSGNGPELDQMRRCEPVGTFIPKSETVDRDRIDDIELLADCEWTAVVDRKSRTGEIESDAGVCGQAKGQSRDDDDSGEKLGTVSYDTFLKTKMLTTRDRIGSRTF